VEDRSAIISARSLTSSSNGAPGTIRARRAANGRAGAGRRGRVAFSLCHGRMNCSRIERRGTENPPVTRDALRQWMEIFEAPTSEEMALFDEP